MKRVLSSLALLVALVYQGYAQYPIVTIRETQEQPLDSLMLADSIQGTQASRWTLQASPLLGDTVTVVALCVVPGKVLSFTQSGTIPRCTHRF